MDLDTKGVIVQCPSCGQRNRLSYGRLGAETRCGKCRTALSPPTVPVEVADSAAFDAAVAKSSLPVVVDFWAPWCGPCHMVAPELTTVASRNAGRYLVVKVNTDAVPDLGERFRVRSIPTMAVLVDGREAGRTTGARPAAEIEGFIESTLAHR